MKKLTPLLGNSQKLDGGAMFGNVPKALWTKWFVPDEKNRITLACRALLIQENNRNILLETGIGAFFAPDLRVRYGMEESEHILLKSLAAIGLTHQEIDVVVLSHMHFDHAGGLLSEWKENEEQKLLFPKAKYLVSQTGWKRALNPHVRDRASFIPHLNQLLLASNRLEIVDSNKSTLLGDDYEFLFSDGHTPGLLHTVVHDEKNGTVIFASDLIPGAAWVHLPVTMGYDRAPELLIDEKKRMLDYAIEKNAKLFFTHDPSVEMGRVVLNDGKYSVT